MVLVGWFILALFAILGFCFTIYLWFNMKSNAFINTFVIVTLVVFTSFSLYVLTSYTKQVDVKLNTIDKTLTDLQTKIKTQKIPQLPSNLTSAKIWEDYYKNRALLMDNIFLVLGLFLPILAGLAGLITKILADKKYKDINNLIETNETLKENYSKLQQENEKNQKITNNINKTIKVFQKNNVDVAIKNLELEKKIEHLNIESERIKKETENAIENLKKEKEEFQNSFNVETIFLLGYTQKLVPYRLKTSEALENFQRALEINPNHNNSLLMLAECFATLAKNPENTLEKAKEFWTKSLECYTKLEKILDKNDTNYKISVQSIEQIQEKLNLLNSPSS